MPDLRNYFRNKVEIKGVEPSSLWYKEGGLFILVDEDEFISVDAEKNEAHFYTIEDPSSE